VFSRFSRKKAKVDALMVVEKAIAVELRTFSTHLETVVRAFEIVRDQNIKIIKLLEKEKNGQ
jgi:hypothetical protein